MILDNFTVKINGETRIALLASETGDKEFPFELRIIDDINKCYLVSEYTNTDELELFFTEKLNFYNKFFSDYKADVAFFRGRNTSPWSNGTQFTLEEKVRPLVKALVDNMYLTISSCQSHSYNTEAYIDIAFTNEDSEKTFKDYILSRTNTWKLFSLKDMDLDKYMDSNHGDNHDGSHWRPREEVFFLLNEMFNLNFQDWSIVRLSIKDFPKNIFEDIYLKFFEEYFMKRRTSELESILKEVPLNMIIA